MSTWGKELGCKGENLAAEYLKKKGFRILARNYHTRYGELDIICSKDRKLVFVEVKTRSNLAFGFPEEAVTPGKIKHLRQAAGLYLENNRAVFTELRFDVITVLLKAGETIINHLEAAF